jgi:dTDP-glucose 4,6-dehydratase
MVVKTALNSGTLKLHAQGEIVGSRQWIHIQNYVDALLLLLERGIPGQSYNISGMEMNNVEVTNCVNQFLAPHYHARTELVEAPPTHDIRYAISDQKLWKLGWKPSIEFQPGLKSTVENLRTIL